MSCIELTLNDATGDIDPKFRLFAATGTTRSASCTGSSTTVAFSDIELSRNFLPLCNATGFRSFITVVVQGCTPATHWQGDRSGRRG
jgi:hypothetical protein